MARYPAPIEQLIQSFTQLPGIGRKTAERFVFYLLKQPKTALQEFSHHLTTVETEITTCRQCFNLAEAELCSICSNSQRAQDRICVVADNSTVFAIEQTGSWTGVYHVLGGVINQLDGIGPDQLHLRELIQRVHDQQVTEITLATNPDTHGETTALYIIEALKSLPLTITRLARGLPSGADIEYADDVTLENALRDRKPIMH